MKPLKDWDNRTTVLSWPFAVRLSFILSALVAAQAVSWAISAAVKQQPLTGLGWLAVIVLYALMIALSAVWAVVTSNEFDYWRRRRWLPFDGKTNDGTIIGVMTKGDPKATPMTWLNQFFVKFRWNKVAILEIDPEPVAEQVGDGKLEWRIGFKPMHGNAKLKVQVLTKQRIRVRIGPESCHFFAIGLDGKEIPLLLVDIAAIDDPRYANLPLH